MSIDLWSQFQKHKYDVSYLTNLAEKHFNYHMITTIKYQINLITLKLCIKRDNLGIPKELWNIICGYIEIHIKFGEDCHNSLVRFVGLFNMYDSHKITYKN